MLWSLLGFASVSAQTWTVEVVDPGVSGQGPWPAFFNNHGHILLTRSSGEWKLLQGATETSYGFVSTPFRALNDQDDALNLGLEIRSISGTVTTGLMGLFQGTDGPYLSPFAGTWFRQGYDLNLARQRVFAARFTTGGDVTVEPVIIDPPLTLRRLGHPPLSGYARLESYPVAMNSEGEVAGTTLGFLSGASQPSVRRAFLYTGGQMKLLPPLAGHETQDWGASDLNDLGQVVGWNGLSGQGFFGVLWSEGQATEITTPAVVDSQAYGGSRINNLGQVLLADIVGSHARVLYQAGQWQLLTDLLPSGLGYLDVRAYDLNHIGQILAYGRKSLSGGAPYEMLLLNPGPSSDFELTPEDLSFTGDGSAPLTVRNLGFGPLHFTTEVEIEGGGNWLTLSPASEEVPPKGEMDLTVTIQSAGLARGVPHLATIRVTAAGITRSASVTLTLPLLDEVIWGPAPFLLPPGSKVSVGPTQPRLFLPVSYRLGSDAAAQLSVEMWDQTGRYLGGTEEQFVVASATFRPSSFVVRGIRSGLDLSGVTQLTLRVVLSDPGLPEPLAISPPIVYPVANPITSLEWGEVDFNDDFTPRAWSRLEVGREGETPRPAVRVNLIANPASVTLWGLAVAVRPDGSTTNLRGALSWTNPISGSDSHTGLLIFPNFVAGDFDGAERILLRIIVTHEGNTLNQTELSIPVIGLNISGSDPPSFTGLTAVSNPDVTIHYRTLGGGPWDLVLLGVNSQVLRVLESNLGAQGSVTAADLSPGSDLIAFLDWQNFGGPKLIARFGLRENGAIVSTNSISWPDQRVSHPVPLTPPAAPPPVEDLKITLRDVVVVQALDLESNIDLIRSLTGAEDPESVVIFRKWSFSAPQPPGQFSAEMELGYFPEDLPDDPGFSEIRLQILAYDPASGSYLPLPTTLDPVNKKATARIDGLAPAYTLGLASPPAEHFVDFPLLDATGTTTAELIVSQFGTGEKRIGLFPHHDSGEAVAGFSPLSVPIEVPPSGQVSLPLLEPLPLALVELASWLRLHAPTSSSAVLALRSPGRADYLAPPAAAPDLVLPLARSGTGGFTTHLHLLNPNSQPDAVQILAISPNGTIAASGVWPLSPRGRLSGELPQLLPSLPGGWSGSLRVRSARGLKGAAVEVGTRAIAVVPFRPVQPDGSGSSHWYAPWFASGGGHRADLALANTGATDLTVQVRALADNGTVLGAPVDRVLSPDQSLREDLAALLNLSGGLQVASLHLEGSHGGLSAELLVGQDADPVEFLAAAPFSSRAGGDWILPAFDESPGRTTAISLVNPSAGPVDASVTVYRADGVGLGPVSIPIPAGGRTTRSLGTVQPAAASLSGGFIRIQCPTPLHAAATVVEDSGNSLAAVIAIPFPPAAPPSPVEGAPEFLGISRFAPDGLRFQSTAPAGTTLQMEQSNDLRTWLSIRFGIHPASNGSVDFTLPFPFDPAAFYRFRRQ